MPGHVLDTRRLKNRIVRKGAAVKAGQAITVNPRRHSEERCTTCPNALSGIDRSQGCRRCKACRTSQPGRPKAAHPCPCGCERDVPHGRTYATADCRHTKAAKVIAIAEPSWWLGLDRAQLNAEAMRKAIGR